MEALQKDKHYTYADYSTWDETIRCELIDGVPYMMTAPSRTHQRINVAITTQFYNFLKDKPCEVYTAPFDVRLNAGDEDDTVVQPDILVVCDSAKLSEKGCQGPPDLVVEILSPSSGSCDRVTKFNKYLQAGVREYWIVDPDTQTVTVHTWENEKYVTSAWSQADKVPSHVLPGCTVDLTEVFAEKL